MNARSLKRFLPIRVASNFAIFFAFVLLTIIMTWPWVLSLRDYAPDAGDSYLNTWILWWDYHQTFHDPLHLFEANILYPYQHTLAFSEHNYGIALILFPLYALGMRPLTAHGIAVLTGFAFAGFAAFRLTRTLTNSTSAAWVAGVVFAFIPFRFHHMPHVTYLFSGWIPLLLEALVLYARSPGRKQAAWLGIAFFLNGLTCIHWFVLTLIPLTLTGLLLVSRHALWRNRRFWFYGALALVVASAALLPFLMPYLWVKNLYGLERSAQEAKLFSAHFINWLMVDWQNKLWKGLGSVVPYQTELALFPGFVPLLLAIAAFRFRPKANVSATSKVIIAVLDSVFVVSMLLGLLCVGYGSLSSIHLTNPRAAFAVAAVSLLVRIGLSARTLVLRRPSFRLKMRRPHWLTEPLEIGLVWLALGFIGSFGMNFFFHRLLFQYVPLFRSIRVPARWAMICFVGLSLLAGVGGGHLVDKIGRSRLVRMSAPVLIMLVIMFEQRAAPLHLVHGAVDPSPVALKLRDTPMRGGVLELPAGIGQSNYLYTLRAADHARPLVDGVSGFLPPIQQAVEEMSNSRPITPRFADLLEAIPVSYVVVHHASVSRDSDQALQAFFDSGVAAGRFRLITRLDSDDLYVVTRTEGDGAN